MTRRFWMAGLSLSMLAMLGSPSLAGKAKSKPVRGKVTSVDADKNTITVEAGKKGMTQSKSFEVAKDARVFMTSVDGKSADAKLADLKPGMTAQVTTSADGKSAIEIRAAAGKKAKKKK